MICSSCGKENRDGVKFCIYCGNKVSDDNQSVNAFDEKENVIELIQKDLSNREMNTCLSDDGDSVFVFGVPLTPELGTVDVAIEVDNEHFENSILLSALNICKRTINSDSDMLSALADLNKCSMVTEAAFCLETGKIEPSNKGQVSAFTHTSFSSIENIGDIVYNELCNFGTRIVIAFNMLGIKEDNIDSLENVSSTDEYCHKCGNKIEPDDNFCTNCGAKRGEINSANNVVKEAETTTPAPKRLLWDTIPTCGNVGGLQERGTVMFENSPNLTLGGVCELIGNAIETKGLDANLKRMEYTKKGKKYEGIVISHPLYADKYLSFCLTMRNEGYDRIVIINECGYSKMLAKQAYREEAKNGLLTGNFDLEFGIRGLGFDKEKMEDELNWYKFAERVILYGLGAD